MNPHEIYKLVENGMAQVEEELARQSRSGIQLIDSIGQYICNSGGKRIRPAMLLLGAKMCGYEGPIGPRLGAVIELILATAPTARSPTLSPTLWGSTEYRAP